MGGGEGASGSCLGPRSGPGEPPSCFPAAWRLVADGRSDLGSLCKRPERSPRHSCPAPRTHGCHVLREGTGPGDRPPGGAGCSGRAHRSPCPGGSVCRQLPEHRRPPETPVHGTCVMGTPPRSVLFHAARAAVGWSAHQRAGGPWAATWLAGSARGHVSVVGGDAEAAAGPAGTPASTPKALADVPGAYGIPRPHGQSLRVTWRLHLSHVLLANPRRTLESVKATG